MSHHFMANRMEKSRSSDRFYFLSKFTVDGDCSHEIKRCLFLKRKTVTNLGTVLKSRDIIMSTKIHIPKTMVFPAVMFRCDYKEGRMPKIWGFWLWSSRLWSWRKLMRVPDSKVIKPVHSKRNQQWILFGRIDAESEASIIWPPDVKSQLIGKDPEPGKEWRQKEKRVAEEELFREHHLFNRWGFLGDSPVKNMCAV